MTSENQSEFINVLRKKCQLEIVENPERLFVTKLSQLFP